jgi:hypothetical protein
MTSPAPEAGGKTPAPAAAPAPAPAPKAPATPDPRSRIRELETELARLRAELAPGVKVLLRVAAEEAIDTFTIAGATISKDPTPVPAHLVHVLLEAAAEAGLRLIEGEA